MHDYKNFLLYKQQRRYKRALSGAVMLSFMAHIALVLLYLVSYAGIDFLTPVNDEKAKIFPVQIELVLPEIFKPEIMEVTQPSPYEYSESYTKAPEDAEKQKEDYERLISTEVFNVLSKYKSHIPQNLRINLLLHIAASGDILNMKVSIEPKNIRVSTLIESIFNNIRFPENKLGAAEYLIPILS